VEERRDVFGVEPICRVLGVPVSKQMRATIRATGTLTPESLLPEAERELLDAFRGWRSQPA